MTNEEFVLMLSQKYYRKLYKYAKQICPDKNLAADIVQETLMVAYEKSQELKKHENILGWLYQTEKNRMSHMLRNSLLYYEELSTLSDTLQTKKNFEDESISAADLYPEIAKLLEPKDMQMLILHYKEKYTFEELAEDYGTSKASVKMRLQRARKKLRENLERCLFIFL